MSENANNDKNDLLNALNSVNEVKVGDVVTGEVLAKDDNQQLIVGIEGSGVEGVVPPRELSSDQSVDDIKQGDKLKLVVTSRIGSDKEGGSSCFHQSVSKLVKFGMNWLKSQRTVKPSLLKSVKLLKAAWLSMPVSVDSFLHQ